MVVCREQAVERDELKLEGKLCGVSLRVQPPSVGVGCASLCSQKGFEGCVVCTKVDHREHLQELEVALRELGSRET